MTRTILELHVLQTVPPSCLNRDDTGTPKTALYGGVRRARVSSQAWKRATRRSFHDLLDPSELGVRTRRVAELLAERICKLDGSIEQAEAWALAAETIQTATGSKIEAPKRRAEAAKGKSGPEPAPESKYLMFLSARQLDGLAELAVKGRGAGKEYFKDKVTKDRAKQIANSRHSVDIALFGRMVADGADINVDAAAQVAHALSVHRVENEADYYTAVDDYKNREADDLGAGMIGTVEFNSATLYRYAAVDVDLLRRNLGMGLREDEPITEPVRRAIEAFVQCFLTSLPTGKINTFGNHTLPDAVVAKVRSSRPVSFVAAFEEPCRADPETGGHLRQASEALASYVPEVERAYGVAKDTPTWVLRVGKNTEALSGLGIELSLPELVTAIGTEIVRRQDGA
ncbi:CRISPR system Cascade subunit CasC [Streptosporangium becharense]|uniref:CRISPR system Cascade subunit CasC n=1 Tax=Streptosporangium becharense TaxID=1816182 RepID=A0A7W9ILV8_9ACTN|nr:type I-E CRISPR-associated protein Cas7/Cse4/CasC [Streptosporangium becharense]MBB2910400.1 CRISPR system Cascade subunit CasC [Streptosporangium becharense]MBB5823143.1 CRISPR system Cascade subunit CasC [Streptosporangium becharense]